MTLFDQGADQLASGALSARDQTRLERWIVHRGAGAPDADTFLTFGALSTLERLAGPLSAAMPEDCGPLRAAMRVLRARKTRASTSTGGARGPAITLSVGYDELPAPWRRTLDRLRSERRRIDAGGLHLADGRPPSIGQIGDMAYVLRQIAKTCLMQGDQIEITAETIGNWLAAAEERGCATSGLSLQINALRRFLLLYDGKGKLTKQLARLRRDYAARAKKKGKRKERWLRENPIEIGEIWMRAEELLNRSRALRPGSRARLKLAQEAACLALGVAVPLRVGDLHRLRLGTHLRRTGTGWSLRVVTAKTGAIYERPALWPELTSFLDELVILDAIAGDLWTGYDARHDQPLFAAGPGASAYGSDWVSKVWRQHLGCGEHIIRTIWHQLCIEGTEDRTWMALALCGQSSPRTAAHYRIESGRARAVAGGRAMLAAARARAMQDD